MEQQDQIKIFSIFTTYIQLEFYDFFLTTNTGETGVFSSLDLASFNTDLLEAEIMHLPLFYSMIRFGQSIKLYNFFLTMELRALQCFQ